MADFLEAIFEAAGGQEGLNTYRSNRDYNKSVKENERLRLQTELNVSFDGFFPVMRFNNEDFAGVSNFENLKAAITKYSNRVQEIVKEYDETVKLDATFKGKAGEELHSFVVATKSLLSAYVRLVEKWNEELDDAYERYQAGDVQLQQNVASDAQAVEQAAQNVSLG